MLALTALPHAKGQPGSVENATALLNEAKKTQHERKRAAKQKELDRISEDVNTGKKEVADLEKTMAQVGSAVNESKSNLDLLAGRRMSATQDLELLAIRSEAEKLKAEGLALLNTAYALAMDAMARRKQELDLKAAIVSAEIQKLPESGNVAESGPKKDKTDIPSVSELRKNLAKAEARTPLADYRARQAMEAASQKLRQAEAVAAKVEKK